MILASQYQNMLPTECKIFNDNAVSAYCKIISKDKNVDKDLFDTFKDRCIVLNNYDHIHGHITSCTEHSIENLEHFAVKLNITEYDYTVSPAKKIKADILLSDDFLYLVATNFSGGSSLVPYFGKGSTHTCYYLKGTDKVRFSLYKECFEHKFNSLFTSTFLIVFSATLVYFLTSIVYSLIKYLCC